MWDPQRYETQQQVGQLRLISHQLQQNNSPAKEAYLVVMYSAPPHMLQKFPSLWLLECVCGRDKFRQGNLLEGIIVSQAKGQVLGPGWYQWGVKRRSDGGYIFKVKPSGFLEELDMEWQKMRGLENVSRFFAWAVETCTAITCDGKAAGREGLGGKDLEMLSLRCTQSDVDAWSLDRSMGWRYIWRS